MGSLNYLALVFGLFFITQVFCWGYQGHALISELAYRWLPAKDKLCVNRYANVFLSDLSPKFQAKLKNYYSDTQPLSRLSALPDTWREKSLTRLFQRFNAQLPVVLLPYREGTTRSWHFFDQAYPSRCAIVNEENAAKMLGVLQQAWWQTSNDHDRALLLILIAHLVGDLHQPLHTLSYADKQCHIDYGGNTYFVMTDSGKRSLHQLWDRGLGYLYPGMSYRQKVQQLYSHFSVSAFKSADDINPYEWVKANFHYADFIYGVPEYVRLDKVYYKKGRDIVKQQLFLAAYRLSLIMQGLCH